MNNKRIQESINDDEPLSKKPCFLSNNSSNSNHQVYISNHVNVYTEISSLSQSSQPAVVTKIGQDEESELEEGEIDEDNEEHTSINNCELLPDNCEKAFEEHTETSRFTDVQSSRLENEDLNSIFANIENQKKATEQVEMDINTTVTIGSGDEEAESCSAKLVTIDSDLQIQENRLQHELSSSDIDEIFTRQFEEGQERFNLSQNEPNDELENNLVDEVSEDEAMQVEEVNSVSSSEFKAGSSHMTNNSLNKGRDSVVNKVYRDTSGNMLSCDAHSDDNQQSSENRAQENGTVSVRSNELEADNNYTKSNSFYEGLDHEINEANCEMSVNMVSSDVSSNGQQSRDNIAQENGTISYINSSDSDDDSDKGEVEDDELYSWLEEGVESANVAAPPSEKTASEETESNMKVERERLIMEELIKDPFDVLPEGWITVTHDSGMPLYLHRPSRVISMTRPYFLGKSSARKHNIPISSIPCLQYRRALDKQTTASLEAAPTDTDTPPLSQENNNKSAESSKQQSQVLIARGDETAERTALGPDEVNVYCSKLFKFKTIKYTRYATWKERKADAKKSFQDLPSLPKDMKLITYNQPGVNGRQAKQYVINPAGKSIVCILHEYCQYAFKTQPTYKFEEHVNPLNPYSATVYIGSTGYATGYAHCKKAAKKEAARLTISVLVPEIATILKEGGYESTDLSFFNEMRIEDPRAVDLCQKASQPSPHQLLLECLKRNHGIHDSAIEMNYKMVKTGKHEYTMKVQNHEATVTCKSKKEGRQFASQSILQLLHPHITSLGAILRLYGKSAIEQEKACKNESLAVTELQQQKRRNKPNIVVLDKLKSEMAKLKESKASGVYKTGMWLSDVAINEKLAEQIRPTAESNS